MKRIRHVGVPLLLACAFGAFGQDEREISPDETSHYGRALTEAAAVNGLMFTFNRFVTRAEYSHVGLDSIKTNVSSAWVWDQDEFLVNQIGHPYQGSYYFVSGRANGLDFYRSGLVGLAGSVSWELFCENETPSRNDLITTTLGGFALGEMFHRLYLGAAGADFPLAFLLSPVDALNGGRPRPDGGKPASRARIRYSVSAGVNAVLSLPDGRAASFPAELHSELAVEYGNPYERDSHIPFSSFEQTWTLDGSPDSFRFGFFSDGFLRSWTLRDDDERRVGAGISLHYDVLFDSDFAFSANSLGATIQRERVFEDSSSLGLKLHLNWIALGASDNALLRGSGDPGVERRDYDMGTGIGTKMALALGNPILGNLLLTSYLAGVFIFPSSVPDGASGGSVWITMRRLVYERALSGRTSLGVSFRSYEKKTRYEGSPNRTDKETDVGVFLRRCFP